jgi:hypothetical protein
MHEFRVFCLSIPDDAWQNTEGDGTRLLATLIINGTYHHLEAIGVTEGDNEQRAINPIFDDALTALYAVGGDGAFETTIIADMAYVIAVTPFQ